MVNREAFDHAIRAAGAILDESEILVIGSQALHASLENLPIEATLSVEVDIVAFDDPDDAKADLIDGTIGEASMFQESFGYYAQGVSQDTAILPDTWRDRLVRYETPATNGVVAWCLEPHDLWVAKAIAGRPKDHAYCRALLRESIVESRVLLDRLDATDAHPAKIDMARSWIESPSE